MIFKLGADSLTITPGDITVRSSEVVGYFSQAKQSNCYGTCWNKQQYTIGPILLLIILLMINFLFKEKSILTNDHHCTNFVYGSHLCLHFL